MRATVALWLVLLLAFLLPGAARAATAADTLRVRALDERCWALNQTKPDSALAYGQQALALARRAGYHRGELFCLNDLGTAYFYIGDYPTALRYHLAALRLARRPADRQALGFAYNGLANIYIKKDELTEARRYYGLALSTARSAADSALYRSNLGYFFISTKQYAEGERHTRAALAIYHRQQLPLDEARCLGNLAWLHIEQRHWAAARAYASRALAMVRPLHNPALQGQYLGMQAIIARETQQPQAALAYLREALRNSRQAADLETQREHYRELALVQAQLGDYRQALAWQQRFQAANDSLTGQAQTQAIAALSARYRAEQQQAHIGQLQARNQVIARQARSQRLLLGAGAGLLVLALALAAVLYSRVRLKQQTVLALNQRNQEIARRDHDKEVLLREMHHRVKNNLQVVSSLLSLQARQLSDPGANAAIRDSRSRVEAMALLHQKLYQHEELRHIALPDYLRLLTHTVLGSYGFAPEEVARLSVDEVAADVDVALPLGLLLNELLTNACKYALPGQPHPRLTVALHQQPNGDLHLRVADNGPGLPATGSEDPAPSFGLRLMGLLARQLDTRLEWSAAPGGAPWPRPVYL
jgi:two-component sensor histidine kinase